MYVLDVVYVKTNKKICFYLFKSFKLLKRCEIYMYISDKTIFLLSSKKPLKYIYNVPVGGKITQHSLPYC